MNDQNNKIFFPYHLDENTILNAISEIKDPILNRDEFYAEAILSRLELCNRKSLKKFDDALDSILKIDLEQSLSKNDFQNISKVIRHTNKIMTKLHKGLLSLLAKLSE